MTPSLSGAATAPGLLVAHLGLQHNGSAALTSGRGLGIQHSLAGAGSIGSLEGIRLFNPSDSGGGGITNNFAIYIDSQTTGTEKNYAIYSAGGSSYHAGNFGLGDSTHAALLTVGS